MTVLINKHTLKNLETQYINATNDLMNNQRNFKKQKDNYLLAEDVDEMDITDAEACRRVITEAKPDAVIHCAAYTAVDAAEQNMELCRKVNADGTRNIAEVCKGLDSTLLKSMEEMFNWRNFWFSCW